MGADLESLRVDIDRSLAGIVDQLAPLRGTTVTVTGGTGFVGTWIAETIAHLNDVHAFGTELVLLARSTGSFESSRPHLAGRPDIRLVAGDVRHITDLPKTTSWLIHAAANPDTRAHSSNPIETMRVIAEGTANVLQTVSRCSDLRLVLHLSSGLVYGPQSAGVELLAEEATGTAPVLAATSAYAEAKRYAESLCFAARSQAHLPIAIARPFTFIGPYHPLDAPWAANGFIREAVAGGPIRVLGSGGTVRSYLYGSDAAAWLLRLATGAQAGRAYNVGSPRAITLADLAALIAAQLERRPDILFNTQPGASSKESRLVPDVAAAAELGLRVQIELEEAVARSVEWIRGRLGAPT